MQYKSISPNLLQHKNACLPIALATIFPDKMIQVKSEKDGYSFGQMYKFGVECEVLITPCKKDFDYPALIEKIQGELTEGSATILFISYIILATNELHFTALVLSKTGWAFVDALPEKGQIKSGRFWNLDKEDLYIYLSYYIPLGFAIWSEQGKIKQAPIAQFSHLFDE